jgi:hypothetical protein
MNNYIYLIRVRYDTYGVIIGPFLIQFYLQVSVTEVTRFHICLYYFSEVLSFPVALHFLENPGRLM